MPTSTFKAVNNYGDFGPSEQIEANIKSYLEWSFLSIQGYNNVTIPSSGAYGGNEHILVNVTPPGYEDNQVYEGFRKNWVWESGFNSFENSISFSGIYIDGVFQAVGSGYIVDYPNGRVIFDTALTGSPIVTAEYSYKRVNVLDSDTEEFRTVQEQSLILDNNFPIQSGQYPEFERNLVQMPLIAIEAVPNRSHPVGMQLGGGHVMVQDILFYIYTETKKDRNRIFDCLVDQEDNTIYMYDLNKVIANTGLPLNSYGHKALLSTTNYNNLVSPNNIYYFNNLTFERMVGQEQTVKCRNIFGAIVRGTFSIRRPEV